MEEEISLNRILELERAKLRRHCIVRSFAESVLGGFIGICLVTLLDNMVGIREFTVASIVGAIFAIALSYFVYEVLFAHSPYRKISDLSLEVENAHEELMDSFACAIELEGKKRKRKLTVIEDELLEDVRRRIANSPETVTGVFKKRTSLWKGLGMICLAAVCICCTMHLKAFRKFECVINGAGSGIEFINESREVPRRTDLKVAVHVKRWSGNASIEYVYDTGEKAVFPMNGESDCSFTFYDVDSSIRYRVFTRDLVSEWKNVRVYEPPNIKEIAVEITPLEYMGLEKVVKNELSRLELVAGEKVSISLRTQEGVAAEIRVPSEKNDDSILAFSGSDGWLSCSYKPKENGRHELRLRDAEGHEASFFYDLDVRPDMPPVITLNEPIEDVQLKPGDSLRIMSMASDDYGLSSLKILYSKNGGERESLELKKNSTAPWEKDWEVNHLWDLPGIGIKSGDMLSCLLVVEDNRQPDAQSARSEIFFIVVRPDPEEVDADGPSSKQQKADISDLIAEGKRLLRLSWDTLSSSENRERNREELVTSLSDLELEIHKRAVKLAEEAKADLPEMIQRLFDESAEAFAGAGRLAQRDLFEEGITQEEKGLASLVAIETEMIKNMMKSKKAQGEEGEGKSEDEEKDKEQQDNSDSGKENGKEELKELKAIQDELKKILSGQEELNGLISRNDTNLSQLAAKQDKIYANTQETGGRIEKMKSIEHLAGIVNNATSEMGNGAKAMRADDRQTGGIHGARARMHLTAAIRALEEAIRKAASNEIKKLAEKADELSEEQRGEAEKNKALDATGAGSEQAKGARERQNEIGKKTEELMKQMRDVAAEIEEKYPEASQDVMEAAAEAAKQGLEQSQAKAKNALLYKRFGKAGREQNDAANKLKALANGLNTAADKMPAWDEKDLRDALEELQKQTEQVNSAMQDADKGRAQKRMDAVRSSASRTLQELSNSTKNEELQDMADSLSSPTGEANPSDAGMITIKELSRAASIITSLLEGLAVERSKQVLRRTAPPPERYRRQVEGYFKKLGAE